MAVLLVVTLLIVKLRSNNSKADSVGTTITRKTGNHPAPPEQTSKSGNRPAGKANKPSGIANDRSSTPASAINRNRGFDRRVSFIEYTKHARCRMECREISQAEVQDMMKMGIINYRKSNVKGRPCPTYALEGNTNDGQHVRIVFAQCDNSTKVVTCIDLEKEWQCHCPGDDNKNQ